MAEGRRSVAALISLALLATVVATGCGGRKRAARTVGDAQQLYRIAERQLAARDLRRARTTLQRVQYSAEDRAELEPLVRLMLADASFYQGNAVSLIEARSMYLDFVTLYGDHPRAAYAQMQAGVCSLLQANNPSRDQGEIKQAIADLQETIRRYPTSPYAGAAADLIVEGQNSLAEHEYLVGRFYLKRKKWAAAADRFETALESYGRFPERDKVLYHLGLARAKLGDQTESELYLGQLLNEFPSSSWAKPGRELLSEIEGDSKP